MQEVENKGGRVCVHGVVQRFERNIAGDLRARHVGVFLNFYLEPKAGPNTLFGPLTN